MELAIYFADIGNLRYIEDSMRLVDQMSLEDTEKNKFFFYDQNTIDYSGNLQAIDYLHQHFGEDLVFSHLYFGQEFCHHLAPTADELLEAYFISRQLGWGFTYVTIGPVTDEGLNVMRTNLRALRDEGVSCEVLANNWGVIYELSQNWGEFQPVCGRMLCKQIRLPRYNQYKDFDLKEIQNAGDTVPHNQLQALRGLEMSVSTYREELKRFGIRRFEVDFVPQGAEIPSDAWGFGVSGHFPWTYVTCGRNCLTAAAVDPWNEYVAVESCPQKCRTENTSTILSFNKTLFQRGNSVFMFNSSFAQPYLDGTIPIDRLVVSPYAPI